MGGCGIADEFQRMSLRAVGQREREREDSRMGRGKESGAARGRYSSYVFTEKLPKKISTGALSY